MFKALTPGEQMQIPFSCGGAELSAMMQASVLYLEFSWINQPGPRVSLSAVSSPGVR
jgi:hypothetical protein